MVQRFSAFGHQYFDRDGDDCDGDFDHDDDDMDQSDHDNSLGFADPGGKSALRAATPDNPRIHWCPTCKAPNRLTQRDVQLGYQCDSCADALEG